MEDKKMNGGGMVCNSCGAGCGGGGCGCGCCGGGYGGYGGFGGHHHGIGFMILRCLLAIIILAVVFSIGVKIGEIKGAYEYGGGNPFGMMRGGWGGGAYQMMGGAVPQGYYYQSTPINRAATSSVK